MENKENQLINELQPGIVSQPEDVGLNSDVSKLGVVVRSFLCQHTNENCENGGTLKLFLDKMQQLEAAWSDNEKKFALLQVENEQLHMQLMTERNKCALFKKRLQFIQENRGHFEKLKEVYSKMKEMELEKQRSKINVHKATQSESMMSVSSYATCTLQPETNEKLLSRKCSSIVSVRKIELDKVQDTINVLKELIYRREQTWALNRNKQQHYVQHFKRLEKENASLRSAVHPHCDHSKEHVGTSMEDTFSRTSSISVKVNAVKPSENMSTNTMDNTLNVMQSIVRKLETRNKELEQMTNDRLSDSTLNIFNKKERVILNQIPVSQECFMVPSTLVTNNRQDEDFNQPLTIMKKRRTKSASSRNRSAELSSPRQSGSAPTSLPHSRGNDSRCHEPSHCGPSNSRRTEKLSRSGNTESQASYMMQPGAKEETEQEILKQIKNEILKKQHTISRKLELFQVGMDKRQKR